MGSMDFESLVTGFIRLTLLGIAAIYAGLVLTSYFTDGPHRRPPIDWRDPGLSATRLATWMGVLAVAFAVRGSRRVLGTLSEASAEVGEWFLEWRHRESN